MTRANAIRVVIAVMLGLNVTLVLLATFVRSGAFADYSVVIGIACFGGFITILIGLLAVRNPRRGGLWFLGLGVLPVAGFGASWLTGNTSFEPALVPFLVVPPLAGLALLRIGREKSPLADRAAR